MTQRSKKQPRKGRPFSADAYPSSQKPRNPKHGNAMERGSCIAPKCRRRLATPGAASPLRNATAAPTGQVWALAFPSSAKSVSHAEVDWLASRGVTAIVAPKLSPTSLSQLTASAHRPDLIVSHLGDHPGPRARHRRHVADVRCIAGTPTAAVKVADGPWSTMWSCASRPAGAADAARSPRRPEPDRGPPAAEQNRSLARWHGYASGDPTDLGVSSSPSVAKRLGRLV